MAEFVKPTKVDELPAQERNSRLQTMMASTIVTAVASSGFWIHYATAKTSTALQSHKKSAERAGANVDQFEWAARKNPDGKFNLYIRHSPQKGRGEA